MMRIRTPAIYPVQFKTRSEIVAPVYARATIVGEIDVDSHTPAAFTDIDRTLLEEAARIVGRYIETRS